MKYYSAIKRHGTPFAATWMDLEVIILTDVSQTEKGKYMIFLTCGILKKMVPMKLFTKQKLSHRCRKQTYGYQGVWGEGINREIGADIYTLLFIK